jgi:hypothetical protein
LQRISTEAGRETDFNDWHELIASDSIRVSFEPDSKLNDDSELQREKHPLPRTSISRGKVTFESDPKYRITRASSRVTKKSPETRKWRFPDSTMISEIPVSENEEPYIICNEAGRQIDFSDEQPESAHGSIRVSFDPRSNVNDERDFDNSQNRSQRTSTEAGMQIACNDEQSENARVSIRVSLHSDSNATDESVLQRAKHPAPRISISRLNVTVGSDPKYRMIVVPSNESKKSPETRNRQFPLSTTISEIPVFVKTEPSIVCNEAGREMDLSDEQPSNALN